MNRLAALLAIVGIGAAGVALAMRRTDPYAVPQFGADEFAQYLDPQGYINFNAAYKPALNDEFDYGFGDFSSWGMAGAPQLGNSYDFDWGAWATAVEPWGVQTINMPADSLPSYDDLEISYMDIAELENAVADHLEGEEGFKDHIYDDVNGKPWTESKRGNPTIGFGHLVTKADIARHGWGWRLNSYDEARALLLRDVNSHLSPIVPHIKVPLTLEQWIAVTSLAFNTGPTRVIESSFLRNVNDGDLSSAERNFKAFNKATVTVDGQKVKREVRGLTNRRNREWALFATPSTVVMLSDGGYAG
jgi:GH24 family phage-related lysozyme (muramidase)